MRVVYYTLWEQLQRIAMRSDRNNIKHIELTPEEYKMIKEEAGKNWPVKDDPGEIATFMGITLKQMTAEEQNEARKKEVIDGGGLHRPAIRTDELC